MSPRRHQEISMPNPIVEREMREICARLDAMETAQRRTPDTGDVSETENENEAGVKEEVVAQDAAKEHLFKVVTRIGPDKKWTS
jgi:hypothetical protein